MFDNWGVYIDENVLLIYINLLINIYIFIIFHQAIILSRKINTLTVQLYNIFLDIQIKI
jgi:hypothetical protein